MSSLLDIAREGLKFFEKESAITKYSIQDGLPKPKELTRFVEAVQKELGRSSLKTSPMDLEEYWRRLVECYRAYLTYGHDDEYDEELQSYLPLLLNKASQEDGIFKYASEKIISDDNEINLLTEIQVFLSEYGPSRHVKFLESDIFRKLNSFQLILGISKKYKENMYIFSPFSTKMFAKIGARKGFFNFLRELYVNQPEYGFKYFKQSLCDIFALPDKDYPLGDKYSLFKELNSISFYNSIYADKLPKFIEGMIISTDEFRGAGVDTYKREVQRIALEILGDPRITTRDNRWRLVSEQAKIIFISWISKYDLDMFFKIISMTLGTAQAKYMWSYRSDFWKAYQDDIKAVWVAFSQTPAFYAKKERLSFGTYSDKQISCLLIVIGNYMFVERSHSGSLKVWPVSQSPCHIGDRYINASAINNRIGTYIEGKEKVDHSSSDTYFWQRKVGGFIADKCGIVKPDKPWCARKKYR